MKTLKIGKEELKGTPTTVSQIQNRLNLTISEANMKGLKIKQETAYDKRENLFELILTVHNVKGNPLCRLTFICNSKTRMLFKTILVNYKTNEVMERSANSVGGLDTIINFKMSVFAEELVPKSLRVSGY